MGLVVALASLWSFASPASAQAPEGNAHPQSQMVSGNSFANPFGEIASTDKAPPTIEQKRDFEAQLDLSPLRDRAVSHNGRIKILDTLARETIRTITGARVYTDYLPQPSEGGKVRLLKVKHDPLFTLLDLIIDPRYYFDKPLLGVEYLPLRREFIEHEYPQDDRAQDLALRQLRITPTMFARHVQKLDELHMGEPSYQQAMAKLHTAVSLWQDSPQNMLLVAPPHRDDPWKHLSSLPADHPARQAGLALGKAWRDMDAQAANAAIIQLASVLPTINPEVYPTTRRSLESFYNRLNAFEWGFWAYALSFVTLLLAFGTGRSWLSWAGTLFFLAGIAMHATGFTARCLIAERFAIQNQFESMTGVSLFAAVVGLVIMIAKRQWLYGAAAAGVGFLVLVTATQTNIPGQNIEREAAILNTSVLLKYHVTTVLVSYGLIALGFIISCFYLATHYLAKIRANSNPAAPVLAAALGSQGAASTSRTLSDLDTAQMTVLQLAFWTLGVGILLGAWWADHSWGRWWAFDPKETWALLTWIVYLIAIHLRFTTTGNRGLLTAWLSAVGFVVMLWTYFGVNLLLPGLHAYA
jgi:cytochrome c-type biogenesis protein CcsB